MHHVFELLIGAHPLTLSLPARIYLCFPPGNLEIVTGAKKYTRDVGVTFPTPSSSEARMEEDSDVTSGSEEKAKEKKFLANYLRDRNLRNHKSSSCEGWLVYILKVSF